LCARFKFAGDRVHAIVTSQQRPRLAERIADWARRHARLPGSNGKYRESVFVWSLCENRYSPAQDGTVIAMDQPGTSLTAPFLSADSAVWFSAYGFGWGYCAFSLNSEVICEQLGAANETPKQLMLAFELGKRRLLQAVEKKALPGTGERISLSAEDL
jgi:hypothetical protein